MKQRAHCTLRVLLALLLPLALAGCVEDYDKSDIKVYIKNTIGITGVTVSSETVSFDDGEGYQDIIWTATVKDTGMVFHVVDDFGWGMESVSNYLWNDYASTTLLYLADDLPDIQPLAITAQVDENGLASGGLTATFSDEAELAECYDALVALKSEFTALGYDGLSVWYNLEYQHPLRYTIPTYEEDGGDSSGRTGYDFSYQDMKNEMVLTALDYRYDIIEDFTVQEIEDALVDYRYCLGVYQGSETERSEYADEDVVYYDDIIASKYAYGVSFSSLYEVLVREGYAVEGDAWHYSFTGVDSVVYEISYDFVDDLYGEYGLGYYYLADGEVTLMGARFYNHFVVNKIEELTGLRLVTGSR